MAGRPTKFKSEYTEELIKFFDIEPYKQIVTESSKEYFADGRQKKESVKYRMIPNKMPTLFGFSRKIGVNYSTVWRWSSSGEVEEIQKKIDLAISRGETNVEDFTSAKDLMSFCNAYKEAKELQKEFLISVGLSGAANAPFAIFTAKNVTDMRDSTVVTHNMPKPLLDVLHNNSNKEAESAQ